MVVGRGFTPYPTRGLSAPRPGPGRGLDLQWFVRDAVEPKGIGKQYLDISLFGGFEH
jgi:hypothetical protein